MLYVPLLRLAIAGFPFCLELFSVAPGIAQALARRSSLRFHIRRRSSRLARTTLRPVYRLEFYRVPAAIDGWNPFDVFRRAPRLGRRFGGREGFRQASRLLFQHLKKHPTINRSVRL